MEKENKSKAKSNNFVVSLSWIFWLGIISFIAYRSFLPLPSDRSKLYLVHTKWSGYQNQILQPGRYYISWQNLLPGNVELLVIPHDIKELYLRKDFRLPSAQNYQVLLSDLSAYSGVESLQNPFEYRISVQIRYRYRAEELLAFVQNPANALVTTGAANTTKDDHKSQASKDILALEQQTKNIITAITVRLGNKLRQRLSQEFQGIFAKGYSKNTENPIAIETYLKSILKGAFPELELLTIDVQEYHQPDLELYVTVKGAYKELLQQLSSQSLERLLEQQNKRIDQELYLQNIERLGKILSEYPLLIQYFAITSSDSVLKSDIIQQAIAPIGQLK